MEHGVSETSWTIFRTIQNLLRNSEFKLSFSLLGPSRSNLLQPSQFECLVHGARKIPMIAAMPLDSGQEPSKAKAFKRGCPEMDRWQFYGKKND